MKLETLKLGTVIVLLGAGTPVFGQQPPPAPPRYGVPSNAETYPQTTPKETLAATLRLLDNGRVEYFAAHVLDPAFVDARVADRAAGLEPAVERELLALRDRQRGSGLPGASRVPMEPAAFAAAVAAEARQRAFRLVVQDIRTTLAESPDHLRDLHRFERAEFAETGDTAKATLRDTKDREVFFRRADLRWYVLDRRTEPPAATVPAEKK